ncbi:hypothetical protein SDJN03_13766, partial [Cucurbita argyrosperma subsp. sororia]
MVMVMVLSPPELAVVKFRGFDWPAPAPCTLQIGRSLISCRSKREVCSTWGAVNWHQMENLLESEEVETKRRVGHELKPSNRGFSDPGSIGAWDKNSKRFEVRFKRLSLSEQGNRASAGRCSSHPPKPGNSETLQIAATKYLRRTLLGPILKRTVSNRPN